MKLAEMLIALERQTALPEIALGLERVRVALALLGNPQDRLPPVVHIAGTNGKGSTLAYLRAMHEVAGLRVHCYSSPHLVRFNERIVLAGHEIEDATLEAALGRVLAVIAQGTALTYFEATTLAAFLAFAETPADVLLLEVGMGGRLDATNVIAQPALCILTPIACDHMEYLGADIAAIAHEKAGILKHNVPAVIASQQPEALHAIEADAAAAGAELLRYGTEWRTEMMETGQLLHAFGQTYHLPAPALAGTHQVMNAGVAAVAAILLKLPERAISEGISRAVWPARLQRLRGGELVEMLPDAELWLDGGHNAHAAEALSAWLRANPMPTALIIGMMRRKDAEPFFTAFLGANVSVITVPIMQEGAASAETLAETARATGLPIVCTAQNLGESIELARKSGAPRVLICGSLYLAGQVLKTHT